MAIQDDHVNGATAKTVTIGVLALQGAFVEHVTLLQQAASELLQQQQHPVSSSPTTSANDGTGTENAGDYPRISDEPQGAVPLVPASVSAQTEIASSISLPSLTQRQRNGNGAIEQQQQQQQYPSNPQISIIQVRNPTDLLRCQGLILPGGESTSISLIAERTGLLEPLRDFVKIQRRPVWGTCAGLILLAESANKSKASGQELIGGLDVRVQRNYFGRQVESFEAALDLPFLSEHLPEAGRASAPFHSVFIRAPVVEKVLPSASGAQEQEASDDSIIAPARKATKAPVEILARLPGRAKALKDRTTTASELGEDGDIVAVRQGNVFGTAFHPELTGDSRIHAWWVGEVLRAVAEGEGIS